MARGSGRAVSEEQKAQRRQDILESARALFTEVTDYNAILMKHVAENIGLTKGTLYLYFKTKEELFLALYELEFSALCSRIQSAAASQTEGDQTAQFVHIHKVFVDSVAGQTTFLRLNALLHSVLEQNIDYEPALAFKMRLRDLMWETSTALEKAFPAIPEHKGAELMLYVHELLLGTWHAATPSPCLEPILDRPDMRFMRLSFEEEFPKLLHYVLKSFLEDSIGNE